MAALVLVSCEDDVITEAMNERDKIQYKPVELDKAEIDLYIITDGDIRNSTTGTVNDKIQQYIRERAGRKFDTELNIVYYNNNPEHADYKKSSEKDSSGNFISYDSYEKFLEGRTSGIVLVNSSALLESMISNNMLADVNGYFVDPDLIKHYEYAKLNASFNKTNPYLLDAARDYITVEQDGKTSEITKLFFVPNNRVLSAYEYLLINKNIVCGILNYDEESLRYQEKKDADGNVIAGEFLVDENGNKVLRSWSDEDLANLREEINNNSSVIEAKYGTFDINEIVKVVSSSDCVCDYAARIEFEEDGYICNILKYPEITKAELAESGFAILSGGFDPNKDMTNATEDEIKAYAEAVKSYKIYEAAAMEIIYLINADVRMRNLLLYGVEGIHFELVDGVVIPQVTEFKYKMTLKYTGDIFQAYFCEDSVRGDDVWTEEMKNNGLKQNLESTFAR